MKVLFLVALFCAAGCAKRDIPVGFGRVVQPLYNPLHCYLDGREVPCPCNLKALY